MMYACKSNILWSSNVIIFYLGAALEQGGSNQLHHVVSKWNFLQADQVRESLGQCKGSWKWMGGWFCRLGGMVHRLGG